MNRNYSGNRYLAGALVALGIGAVQAGDDLNRQIALARSAAPAAISDRATVVIGGEVVAQGDNGWTCMLMGGGSPMCNDAVWMEAIQAMQTQGDKADFAATRVGVSYMLQGDAPGAGVSNADPFHPDPTQADDYVEAGPHLMIIAPRETLQGITEDPSSGGPYVMWGGTPFAHIMVPLK